MAIEESDVQVSEDKSEIGILNYSKMTAHNSHLVCTAGESTSSPVMGFWRERPCGSAYRVPSTGK